MGLSLGAKQLWRLRTAKKFLENVIEDIAPKENESGDTAVIKNCIAELTLIIGNKGKKAING